MSALLLSLCLCAAFPARVYAEPLVLHYDGMAHTYVAPPITLQINGRTLTDLPMPPVIINDRTLVPARETFEALGAVVIWQPTSQEIYIGYEGKLIILQINNLVVNIDGVTQPMDTHPRIINGKTMIPLRFASEARGLDVGWDPVSRVASVGIRMPVITQPPTMESPSSVSLPQQSGDSLDIPRDISEYKIPEANYPETKITGVNIPDDRVSVFSVTASGPISKVDTFPLSGNRIVLDFYNAEMAANRTSWAVGSALVERVRMAQNQTEPEKITRVVFDLEVAAAYRVEISPDRTEVFVIFESNIVNSVHFHTNSQGDYVDISLNSAAAVNIIHLTNPDRIVIDVPYATISDISTRQVNGRFVREMRTNQFESYTARIVLELNQKVSHTVVTDGLTVTVRISEPTFRNIEYDEDTKTITISKGGLNVSATNIVHYDFYDFKKYILSLPADLSAAIGHGEYMVHDDYLQSIAIQNNRSGFTELTLNTRRTIVARVTDDHANIYIKLLRPQEVYNRIVVIDPGHGGRADGAAHFGLREKDLNLSIAQKVMALIEQDGRIKAYATRNSDVYVELIDRSTFGNDIGDLFISIHNNASDRNPNAHGTETYYYNHSFDHLLGITGKEAAEILHRRLLERLGSFDRRVEHKNLSVTRESTIPAVLLEIGFISNEEEAARLATEAYQQLAAQAIFDGIIEIFEVYTPRRP